VGRALGSVSRPRERMEWQAETEAAPIRYWVELVGTDTKQAIRWLIALRWWFSHATCWPLSRRHGGSMGGRQQLVSVGVRIRLVEFTSAAMVVALERRSRRSPSRFGPSSLLMALSHIAARAPEAGDEAKLDRIAADGQQRRLSEPVPTGTFALN
jgi:hypothetical protein